ncbi:MAG TPA: DUF1905 domain-containing protein [Microlunatus sp.]
METFEFESDLWIWRARREDGWTFLSVPVEVSDEIRELALARPPAGFGSVRVSVTLGSTTWQTSVFPGEDGRYALPVKKSVRRAEAVEAGDTVSISLRVMLPDIQQDPRASRRRPRPQNRVIGSIRSARISTTPEIRMMPPTAYATGSILAVST